MIAMAPSIATLCNDLSAVLEEEAALLEQKLAQLEGLSQAIIRRDDPTMERLLEEVEQAQSRQSALDDRMGNLRLGLSRHLGAEPTARLSDLATRLPKPLGQDLARRRARIVELANRLRVQHLETSMLLRECARINRMMLEAITSRGPSVTTYGAGGKSHWQSGGGLINAER